MSGFPEGFEAENAAFLASMAPEIDAAHRAVSAMVAKAVERARFVQQVQALCAVEATSLAVQALDHGKAWNQLVHVGRGVHAGLRRGGQGQRTPRTRWRS